MFGIKTALIVIILFFFIFKVKIYPQNNYEYSYDEAGNRISRIISSGKIAESEDREFTDRILDHDVSIFSTIVFHEKNLLT